MCDEMGRALAADPDLSPDAPEMRAIMQAGETEATAWAFAAGRAIGLPDHVIIEAQDYDGEGEGIRFGLALNAYVGINGMVRDRKSTRLTPVTNAQLVCSILLETTNLLSYAHKTKQ